MPDNHRAALSVRFVAPVAATLVAVTSLVGSALGGPVNPIRIQGSVTIQQDSRDPNTWLITTSDGAIIQYDSFDISASELILFQLPSSVARVLNRITGGAPTVVDGTIGSNGIVYFVNPAGVIFGSGAVIDVGGIYAAAGSITDSDFTNRIDRFSLTGAVENQGTIKGNLVHLLGNSVVNNGSINVGDGVLTMVSGDTVLISPIDPNGHVMVTIDVSERTERFGDSPPSGAGVVNSTTGVITAAGGQIVLGAGDLFALAIRNDGVINAPDSLINMSAMKGDIQNTGGINSDNGLLQMTTLSGKIFDSGAIATEQVEMTADQIVLESTISSNNILFDGAVLLEESVDLFLLELNPDEVLSVTFNSTLDSAAGENNSLGIFHDLARFNGQVGAQTDGQLGTLFVFGGSEINTDLMAAGVLDFDDILLLQDTTLDASTQALFFGGIDSEDFAFHNLVINSPDIYFAGQVGNLTGVSLLGNLTTNGTTTIDTDAVNTLFNIDFNGDVFIAQNTTVTGGFGVSFGGRVDSEDFEFNRLTVNSIDTYFGGQVGGLSDDSRLGALHTDSAGTTTIDTNLVRALVGLDFDDDVIIFQNATLIGELSVDFAGRLDSRFFVPTTLSIISFDTQFHGRVGGDLPDNTLFNRVTTNNAPFGPDGSTTIDTDIMTALNSITFNNDVLIAQDVTMTAALGGVTFLGRLDSTPGQFHDLILNSSNATFAGQVGNSGFSFDSIGEDGGEGEASTALGLLRTGFSTFIGQTFIATNVVNAVDLDFDNDVVIGRETVTLTGLNSVDFADELDSSQSLFANLIINSPQTTFNGRVGMRLGTPEEGGIDTFGSIVTNADGTTTINTDAFRSGTITFNDDVVVASANATLFTDRVTFNRTLNGADEAGDEAIGQSLLIDGNAEFNGKVGGNAKLRRLEVTQGTEISGLTVNADTQIYKGTVVFSGDTLFSGDTRLTFHDDVTGTDPGMFRVHSKGEVLFDGDVTITANGNVVFNVSDDPNEILRPAVPTVATIASNGDLTINAANFTMGQNQKLSVIGDLMIDVKNGTASLGDISTLGMIAVTADTINLLLRSAGRVEDADGNLSSDFGLDLVAGTTINFSVVPTSVGSGPRAQFATSSGGGDVTGNLLTFLMHAVGPLTEADFLPNPNNGTFPIDGTFLLDLHPDGPITDNHEEALGALLPDAELDNVAFDVLPGPNVRRRLATDLAIPARLLSPEEAVSLVAGRALYLDTPGAGVDRARQTSQVVVNRLIRAKVISALESYDALLAQAGSPDEVRSTFDDAWGAFLESSGEGADPATFAGHLAATGNEGLLDTLRMLKQLAIEISGMGLTQAETELPMANLHALFLPERIGDVVYERILIGLQ